MWLERLKKVGTFLLGVITIFSLILTLNDDLREKFKIENVRYPIIILIIFSILFLITIVLQWEKIKLKFNKIAEKHKKYTPTFTLILFILASLMLILSVWQVFCINSDLEVKVSQIGNTYFHSVFPNNLRFLTKLISKTKKKLIIVNDYLTYGIYTKPVDYKEYAHAIDDILGDKGVDFRLMYYNEDVSEAETRAQIENMKFQKEGESLKAFLNSREFKTFTDKRWNSFKNKKQKYEYNENETDEKKLKELKRDFTEEFLKHLVILENRRIISIHGMNDSCLKPVRDKYSLFFWIVDDKEAMFTFHRLRDNAAIEVAFVTTDWRLIKQLEEIYNDLETKRQKKIINSFLSNIWLIMSRW